MFFIKIYEGLRNRKYIPMRFLSPFRYVWRRVANVILPRFLKKKVSYSKVYASSYLSEHHIEKKLVISLTSFPARISKLWMVIECLKRQTIKPDLIRLYLSKEQFATINILPDSLKLLQDECFQIILVDDDLRSHKKYYYSFQEYPTDLVLLIDDDIFYPLDMVKSMLDAYLINPHSIVCRFGYRISYTEEGTLIPYSNWKLVQEESLGNTILFGTGGGSLFEPQLLYNDVCKKELFLKYCPLADDIWINAMVRLSKLNIVKLYCGGLLSILFSETTHLYKENVIGGQNDKQIDSIESYYREQNNVNIFKLV